MIETDGATPAPASPRARPTMDDRSMRLVEWSLAGIALLVALALALVR